MGVMVKNKVARFFMDHGVYIPRTYHHQCYHQPITVQQQISACLILWYWYVVVCSMMLLLLRSWPQKVEGHCASCRRMHTVTAIPWLLYYHMIFSTSEL